MFDYSHYVFQYSQAFLSFESFFHVCLMAILSGSNRRLSYYKKVAGMTSRSAWFVVGITCKFFIYLIISYSNKCFYLNGSFLTTHIGYSYSYWENNKSSDPTGLQETTNVKSSTSWKRHGFPLAFASRPNVVTSRPIDYSICLN